MITSAYTIQVSELVFQVSTTIKAITGSIPG